jgi:hypothetical protein
MGRPPGSTNRKKAAKATGAEQTKPRADNPKMSSVQANGPTAEEKRQYLENYRKRMRAVADHNKVGAELRGGVRSLLRSFEQKGGSSKMLRRMWELTDMSKAEAEAEVQEFIGYATDIGISVSFNEEGQATLDDMMKAPPPKPTPAAEISLKLARAYSDGWNSAMSGGAITDNPFRQGTEEGQQWAKGMTDYVWEQENGRNPGTPPASPPAKNGPDLPADPA